MMTTLIKLSFENRCRARVGVYPLMFVAFFALTVQCFGQQSDTVHYEYDRLNRLTKVTYDSSGASITYTYDAAGNRTATTVQGTNLAPVLTSLNPGSVPAGNHGFTLGINGNNLINGATVRWNGSTRPATYFGSFVTIELTDADLAAPGNFSVIVVNPAPSAAQSNPLTFTVGQSNGSLRIDSVIPVAGRASGGQQITLTGSFTNLSSVLVGGVTAPIINNSGTQLTVSTPQHAVGAVAIDLLPSSGSTFSKPNAFAFLPTTFTDDVLVTGVTAAKAQHIIELRQAVDALRAVAGLGPAQWTDGALVPTSTVIKTINILELRMFLDDAASRLGYATQPYTDTSFPMGLLIKRVHIEELRQRIRAIAG